MNYQVMPSNRKYLYIFLIIGSITFIVLITLFREQINNLLIKPLLLLIDSILQFLAIFDQNIVWVSFLIIFTMILLIALIPAGRKNDQSRFRRPVQPSRLTQWRRYIDDFSKGNYLKWRFGQRMSSLVLRAVALKYNLPDTNLIEQLNRAEVELPKYLYDYMLIANQPYLKQGRARHNFLWGRTDNRVLDFVTPDMVVSYLEKELRMEANDE
jgi:hypothetical protein